MDIYVRTCSLGERHGTESERSILKVFECLHIHYTYPYICIYTNTTYIILLYAHVMI